MAFFLPIKLVMNPLNRVNVQFGTCSRLINQEIWFSSNSSVKYAVAFGEEYLMAPEALKPMAKP